MKWLSLASAGLLLVPEIAIAQQNAPQVQPVPGRPGGPGGPGVRPNPGQGQRPPGVRPPNPGPGNGVRPPVVRPPNPGPGNGGRPPIVRPPNPGPGNGTRPPITRPPVVRPPNPGHGHRPPYAGQRPPNFRPIQGPGFRYPHGYRYRRWTIGLLLPSLFLSSAYYFDNYASYGVYPPPPRHRWVRYGPDLLLVNTRTGRIRDVIYGAFR